MRILYIIYYTSHYTAYYSVCITIFNRHSNASIFYAYYEWFMLSTPSVSFTYSYSCCINRTRNVLKIETRSKFDREFSLEIVTWNTCPGAWTATHVVGILVEVRKKETYAGMQTDNALATRTHIQLQGHRYKRL